MSDDSTTHLKEPRAKTVKAVAALSGNVCAYPECSQRLWDPDLDSFVGEIAHIYGQSPGGPRYDRSVPSETVHGIGNVMLMCALHHKVVDDHPTKYSVSLLLGWKRAFEEGPLEPPDLMILKAVRELLAEHTSGLRGDLARLQQQIGSASRDTLLKDLPVFIVGGTGGALRVNPFKAQWQLLQVGGQTIGAVAYRFRGYGPEVWRRATFENRPAGRRAAEIRGEFELTGFRGPTEWPELAHNEIGLEVAFEYAGRWWEKRFAARWNAREAPFEGKIDLVEPRDRPTVERGAPPEML